jgi:superfamily II DNA helicase RecQ
LQWKEQTADEMIAASLEMLYGKGAKVRSELQANAIKFVMEKSPISVVIMPTGAGKSILFTVPAAFREAKLTVVIVPLSALLDDMVKRCQNLGLRTHKWDGLSSHSEKALGSAHIVVAGTWSCRNASFRTWLKKVSNEAWLDRIVIDEAHLLYSQGSFRSEMSDLYWLRDCGRPLLLLTATLPPQEEWLLERKLMVEKGSSEIRYFRLPTTRPNIHYIVRFSRHTDNCLPDLLADIERESETLGASTARAIVYCRSHKEAEQVGRALNCGVYHSGLKNGRKMDAFNRWAIGGSGVSKFISATSGLGVGIDIPSVRLVYHFRESQDFLGFVQESGRAGRDGLLAKSKVFLDTTSLERFQSMGQSTSAGQKAIYEYHSTTFCRRETMAFYVDGVSAWCAQSKDPDLLPCDKCQVLMSQARRNDQPAVANACKVNSDTQVLLGPNSPPHPMVNISIANDESISQLPSSSSPIRRLSLDLDLPLAPFPYLRNNPKAFRIPAGPPRSTPNKPKFLYSNSKQPACQRGSISTGNILEPVDDEYLSPVHSSDAWLSPHPADQDRNSPPLLIQASTPRPPLNHDRANIAPAPPSNLSISQTILRREALEKGTIDKVLMKLQNYCVICWYTGQSSSHQDVMTCPLMEQVGTLQEYRTLKSGLKFAPYSCCFLCLMPYNICRRGCSSARQCSGQYKDILLPLLFFLFKSETHHPSLARHIGPDNMRDVASLQRWAKPKVRWNGLECTNIWVLFVSLVEDENCIRNN